MAFSTTSTNSSGKALLRRQCLGVHRFHPYHRPAHDTEKDRQADLDPTREDWAYFASAITNDLTLNTNAPVVPIPVQPGQAAHSEQQAIEVIIVYRDTVGQTYSVHIPLTRNA